MPNPNASKLIDEYIAKAQPFAFSLAPRSGERVGVRGSKTKM